MTSRIKHLQLAKLYLSTRVANTKSMTPKQLRFRASGFKGSRHIPLGPCSGFKAKRHDFYSSFLFLFAFSFLFHLEDYIGLHTWVTQPYYRSSTCQRPTLQSERRYIASQPIGTIWSVVCELAKWGMLKVDYAGTSIDQKLNHAWNFSITKVTHRASIFQLKAREETQNVGTKKMICKSYEKQSVGRTCITSKTKLQMYENYLWLTHYGNEKARVWNGTSSKIVAGAGLSSVVNATAVVNTKQSQIPNSDCYQQF